MYSFIVGLNVIWIDIIVLGPVNTCVSFFFFVDGLSIKKRNHLDNDGSVSVGPKE